MLGSVASSSSSGGGNFLIPNGTFIVELVIFIIVLGIVAKFILPPIQKAMDDRDEMVRAALSASDEGRSEADRLVAERQQVLAEARATARATVEKAAAEVASVIEVARANGTTEQERLVGAARQQLAAQSAQLRSESLAHLGDLVAQAASQVIGAPVEQERHRAVIDELVRGERDATSTMTLVFASAGDFGESFLLEVAALLVIIGLMYRYAVPRLSKLMNQRQTTIRTQLAAGEEARRQTEELLNQRRQELETARGEAKQIVEQASRNAEQLIADGQRRSTAEYERLVAHAQVQIDLERNRTAEEIANELSSLVIDGARRVVDVELDASRQRQLIDLSITSVESGAS